MDPAQRTEPAAAMPGLKHASLPPAVALATWLPGVALLGLVACADEGIPSLQDTVGGSDISSDAAVDDLRTDLLAEGSVGLVRQGASSHSIVLNPGASASEKQAATEIQQYVKSATGITLPIREGEPDGGGPMLVLGMGSVSQKHNVAPDKSKLGEEGFLLRTAAPHLFIAGTPQGGTLHGAHRFLESYLGVRWLAPGVTLTPSYKDVWVAPQNRIFKPAFSFRQTSYAWPGADSAFYSRVGYNSGSAGADSAWGQQIATWGRAHTYHTFVDPETYFLTHPEYFSEIGGVRRKSDTQLCLTNPEVLDLVEKEMLELMKQKPSVKQFGFSQVDDYAYCRCSKCQAMNTKYKTTGGTQLWFVNELAKRTAKVYPDKLVTTLAYMYTEAPPVGLTLQPNVGIWLCHMFPSCDSHPITTCKENAAYKARAEAWAKLTTNLYVWHYIVNFTHYYVPFPNLRAMASHIKFYRDIGVKGIYLQGMSGKGGGGELSLLRPFLGMKLLWDPDQSVESLIQEFLKGYYGAAQKPIGDYIALLHDKVEKENIHMHLYTNPAQGYLPDDVVAKAEKLFDQAEALVTSDATLLERVRVARMPLVYARFFPRNGYAVAGGKLGFKGTLATMSEIWDLVQRMLNHGFEYVSEMIGNTTNFLFVAALIQGNPKVVTLKSKFLSLDVVPNLGSRLLRIRHLASGKEITASDRKTSLYYPFCGGMEAQVGSSFRYYGWIEPGIIVSQSRSSITLRSTTTSNLTLTRTFTLDPDKPVVKVTEQVTNPQTKSTSTRLRSRLSLDLGDLAKIRYRFTSVGQTLVDSDLTQVRAGLREGKDFYDKEMPSGSWTFSGDTGLKLTQRFTTSKLDHTLLFTYPDSEKQLHVEVWADEEEIQAGASISLELELEVQAVP